MGAPRELDASGATSWRGSQDGRDRGHVWRRAIRNLAFQDWIILAFLLYVAVRLQLTPPTTAALVARETAFALFGSALLGLGLVRGEVLPAGRPRALLYRLAVFLPMSASYFAMLTFLPAMQMPSLDSTLYAFDRAVLGETPAVWLAQFNAPATVEWFSFFYYSYFFILALVVLPGLFVDRGRLQRELLAGTVIVCVVGHTGYTVVPGFGPYRALAFNEPLVGGLWWSLVDQVVSNAGIGGDIFPSLHTAYPSFFALHAFANRAHNPYRWTWPLLAVFALNIIGATMFLRWHWAVDVAAGLLLAAAARVASVWIARNQSTRNARGLQHAWEPLRAPPPDSTQA